MTDHDFFAFMLIDVFMMLAIAVIGFKVDRLERRLRERSPSSEQTDTAKKEK